MVTIASPLEDLVPVYHMGQSQILSFWGLEDLSRRWRASLGFLWGAYGLPVPRKRPIISLMGAPIKGCPPPPPHCLIRTCDAQHPAITVMLG
jgi:hypothetical protein